MNSFGSVSSTHISLGKLIFDLFTLFGLKFWSMPSCSTIFATWNGKLKQCEMRNLIATFKCRSQKCNLMYKVLKCMNYYRLNSRQMKWSLQEALGSERAEHFSNLAAGAYPIPSSKTQIRYMDISFLFKIVVDRSASRTQIYFPHFRVNVRELLEYPGACIYSIIKVSH